LIFEAGLFDYQALPASRNLKYLRRVAIFRLTDRAVIFVHQMHHPVADMLISYFGRIAYRFLSG
jgi:hypothetical protein